MEKDNNIGRLLDGRYEILEVLGTGGMAVVYKAKCHRLNRLVAIKILKNEFSQDEEFRRRFYGESQAVAMLSHPNIVSIYDVSSSKAAEYIVMELIDGITLKQYMEKKGVLNWKETLHFATQIAKALEHAHAKGIVHRDIKPHNVMVLKSGAIKVMDFGIAQTMTSSNTKTKEALGSVHYISPEQAKGGRVDNRSDIYSLGVMMYEMVAGRVPYDGDSPVNIALQHLNGKAEPPSVFNPNIPKGLEQIIMKAMSLMARDRYTTATAMLYDMDEFRKNPEKLFVLPPLSEEGTFVMPPVTPVDRSKGSEGDTMPLPKVAPHRPRPVPVPEPEEEEPEEEERPSRVVTVAIVSCVVVGLVALIVFVILLAQSEIFTKPQKVEIPDLVGEYYATLPEYEGLEIVRQGEEYSDLYPAGQIIYQYPLAGNMKDVGTTVFVKVSLGEKPPVKTMGDLAGLPEAEALRYLQDLNLSLHVITRKENSSTVPAGHVISTAPAATTPLEKGQNVTITVSLGTQVVMSYLPKVVGYNVEAACRVLNWNGFENIEIVEVNSSEPAGTVLHHTGELLEEINVTTLIVLTVSNGIPEVTVPPTDPNQPTDPTPPADPGPESIEYAFTLPVREEAYLLSIQVGDIWLVQDRTIEPGENQLVLSISGSGMQIYRLYIDGIYYTSETVDFDLDD